MRKTAGEFNVNGRFRNEDVQTQQLGTVFDANWANDITDDLLSIQEAAKLADNADASGASKALLAAFTKLCISYSFPVAAPFYLPYYRPARGWSTDLNSPARGENLVRGAEDYFPAICLSKLPPQGLLLSDANWPDLVPTLRDILVSVHNVSGPGSTDTQWSVTRFIKRVAGASTIYLQRTASAIYMMRAFEEHTQPYFSDEARKTVTLEPWFGAQNFTNFDVAPGEYEVISVFPGGDQIKLTIPGIELDDDIVYTGPDYPQIQIYPHRIAPSLDPSDEPGYHTRRAQLFGVSDAVIRSISNASAVDPSGSQETGFPGDGLYRKNQRSIGNLRNKVQIENIVARAGSPSITYPIEYRPASYPQYAYMWGKTYREFPEYEPL